MNQIFTKAKLICSTVVMLGGLSTASAQYCFDPGTGADGAYTATANVLLPGGTYNFTTFTINAGVTVGVSGTQPLLIHCTGAVTINGTLRANGGNGTDGITFSSAGTGGIAVGGGADGGNGSYSSSTGPLPGVAGSGTGGANTQGDGWSGGGGSGYAVAGSASGGVGGFGGPSYGTADISGLWAGSGGGGGSGGYSCGSGGGGAGGGCIRIESGVSIVIAAGGMITCNGGNGGSDGTGNCGGGGGGSGGSIWLGSASMTNNGTLSCTGGTGGASAVPGSPYYGTGANGAVGRIRLDYNGSLAGSGTTNPAVGSHQAVPVNPFSTLISGTNISCFGGNNGSAVVSAFNGVSPYSYSWSPSGGNGSSATGLTAGTYTCVISDASGCVHTETVLITEPATAVVSASSSTNVDCNGNASGSATVTVTGGSPGYTYSWTPSGGTNATETGLAAGTYICTITDASGCVVTETVNITEPDAVAVSVANVSDASQCGGSDGAIDISVAGGTPSYTYSWSNAATTEDLTGLVAGMYSCTVTDGNGCTGTISATVNDPALPVVTLAMSPDTVCQTTQIPFTITGGTPAGGTYSGPGVNAGVFDPMQAAIGFNVIAYSYTDPNTNCSAVSYDSVLVDICSGISSSVTFAFEVNPNPNDGKFIINLGQVPASPVMVEITNAIGQRISSFMMNNNQKEVDLAPYENGVYLVRITSQNSSAVVRVVKQ